MKKKIKEITIKNRNMSSYEYFVDPGTLVFIIDKINEIIKELNKKKEDM